MMDKKGKSENKANKLQKLIFDKLGPEQQSKGGFIPEKPLDPSDQTQMFYKIFTRHGSDQVILKHGYKLFRLTRNEQDLGYFCLSLLQFEAKFPLRLFSLDVKSEDGSAPEGDIAQKDMWLETQFLLSSVTAGGEYEEKERSFQNKVYNFFKDLLVPELIKFKENRMSWDYMVTEEYTDEKVIHQFQQQLIKWANHKFRQLCTPN